MTKCWWHLEHGHCMHLLRDTCWCVAWTCQSFLSASSMSFNKFKAHWWRSELGHHLHLGYQMLFHISPSDLIIFSLSTSMYGCGLWRHLDPKSSRRLRSEHGHHSVCSCGLRYKRRQTENENIGGGSVKKSLQSSTTTTTATITTAILKDFL